MRSDPRPSTGWYWGAGAMAVAGMVGAAVWAFLTFLQVPTAIAAFPRMPVPGEAVVEVAEPGNLTIYYEAPRVAGDEVVPPLSITVTGPSGATLTPTPYRGDLRFDIAGRVAVAAATFEASSAGAYGVSVGGDAPASAAVSVGPRWPGDVLANVVGALVLWLGTTVVAIAIVVIVATRRNRPLVSPPPTPAPRTPVGAARS